MQITEHNFQMQTIKSIMYEEDNTMNNTPEVKIGIVAVSRDCFPESLSVNRRKALVEAYKAKYDAAGFLISQGQNCPGIRTGRCSLPS